MSEELKISALGLSLGISMAPGDDIVQLLGHERLFGVVVLHGNMVMGEQEALFIEASIQDSPTVHTRVLGLPFGVESPMTSVLAPTLGNDCSREEPKSLLSKCTADKLMQFISASYMAATDVSLLLSHTLNTLMDGLDVADVLTSSTTKYV